MENFGWKKGAVRGGRGIRRIPRITARMVRIERVATSDRSLLLLGKAVVGSWYAQVCRRSLPYLAASVYREG